MKIHVVAGFLGSGKTTAISQACKALIRYGVETAVITNDQGKYLVDSEYFHSLGLTMGEVTGGCFCCNYDELTSEIGRLKNERQTSVIFAESVGSCTDLVATVLKPLHVHKGNIEQVTFSTLTDARLLHNYIKDGHLPFQENTNYIFQKQIEEAHILIVNKADLLSDKDYKFLEVELKESFPQKIILFQNSLNPEDIKHWLEVLAAQPTFGLHKSLEIDYNKYAAGEANLAWLDESIEFLTPDNSAVEIARAFILAFTQSISHSKLPIGHLKFMVHSNDRSQKFSYTTMEDPIDAEVNSQQGSNNAQVIVNARIETSPDMLRRMVARLVTEFGVRYRVNIKETKISFFKPNFPRPTHRFA